MLELTPVARVGVVLLLLAGPQTASAALPTLDLQIVTNQLTNVTCIANAGDGSGRLFVAEQGGRVKILTNATVLSPAFLNISSLVLSSGEQGLLGLAFDPGYATNGYVYVYYTHPSGDSNIVARFTAVPPSANVVNIATRSEVISLTHTNQSNHNGGGIQFGPDGYLYIGTGDGGGGCDPVRNAQSLNSPLGKLLRLDVRTNTAYRIPGDNPFVGGAGRGEIWATGLRNPWRFSFDRATGDLWIGDVGQSDREEVDFQPAGVAGGRNYGWPDFEGFKTNTCGGGSLNPHTLPVLDYDHSGSRIAITGGYRYRGTSIPPLVGTYLFADEKSSSPVYGATQSVAGVWGFVVLTNTPLTVTTFGEDEAGEIYLSHYSSGTAGAVYRIIWRDSDHDGLPDDYEIANGFNLGNPADAGLDADGDGVSNLGEFLAGTDPRNAGSVLRILATAPSGNDWTVTINTVPNKLYRVERTDDLVSGIWSNVATDIRGTGTPLLISDPGCGDVAAPILSCPAHPVSFDKPLASVRVLC